MIMQRQATVMRLARWLPFTALLLLTASTHTNASTDQQTQPRRTSTLSLVREYEVISIDSATLPLHEHPPTLSRTETSARRQSFTRHPPREHAPSHLFSFHSSSIIGGDGDSDGSDHSFHVRLRRSSTLLSQTYSESRQSWDAHGQRMKELEPQPRSKAQVENCYYRGSVNERADGSGKMIGRVAVDTCGEGVEGMIILNQPATSSHQVGASKEWYVIEPAHKHFDRHALHSHLSTLRTQHMQRLQTRRSLQSTDRSSYAHATLGNEAEPQLGSLHVIYRLRDAQHPKHAGRSSGHAMHTMSSSAGSLGGASILPAIGCGVGMSDVDQTPARATQLPSGESIDSDEVLRTADETRGRPQLAGNVDDTLLTSDGKVPLLNDTLSSPYSSSTFEPRKAADATSTPIHYVELLLANDARRYHDLADDTEKTTAAIANLINSIYEDTPFSNAYTLEVVLIGQITFTNHDPWNLTLSCGPNKDEVCVDELLSTWNVWRRNDDNTYPYEGHDAGHLYSGLPFQGTVLGYAGVAVMCIHSQSGGIEQMTSDSVAFDAAIGAHELGHNLGMQHDGIADVGSGSCPKSGFIMNAEIGTTPPTQFSSCSLDFYRKWASTGADSCLLNAPTQRYGDAVCGNGYIEEGEQCDCGRYPIGMSVDNVPVDFCQTSGSDACCDAISCQFKIGAKCSASDACCDSDTCLPTPKSANKVCRGSADFCDVAETCDGQTSACPIDSYVGNGLACTSSEFGAGACFEGHCQSQQKQCRGMSAFYSGGPFSTCPGQGEQPIPNVGTPPFCQELFCRAGGNAICSYFPMYTGTNPRVWMTDGNPCGASQADGVWSTDQLCFQGSCVPAEETNTRFSWQPTAWEKCSDCSTTQNRNVSCIRVATGETVDDAYCTASGRPATRQQCSDEELLCDDGISGVVSFTVYGRVIEVNATTVMIVGAAIFVLLCIITHTCVKSVRPLSEEEKERKRMELAEMHAISPFAITSPRGHRRRKRTKKEHGARRRKHREEENNQ